jgi:CRISPR/Cas system-associated exonuclease Cas4 (RecB family)
LAKELGRIGRPSIDSPAFSRAVEQCGFWTYFSEQLAEWNAKLARHPRAGSSYVLRTKAADLANLAVRLFREQYRTGHGKGASPMARAHEVGASARSATYVALLEERGHLSELLLRHPSLPLLGVLDLVQRGEGDRVAIIDFKTGVQRPDHKEQLETYAVLWWRVTGHFPTHVAVQYLDSSREWPVSPEEIQSHEDVVAAEIKQCATLLQVPPGPAQPGQFCRWCPVRARCDEGWKFNEHASLMSSTTSGSIDLEVMVATPPGARGFLAQRPITREVKVVYEPATGARLPLVAVGDRIRLIDAVAQSGGFEIAILPWTETYRQ